MEKAKPSPLFLQVAFFSYDPKDISFSNVRVGAIFVKFSCPSSNPTTIQLYLSRIPLSRSDFPQNSLLPLMMSCRSFISRFSISRSSGMRSVLRAVANFCNWSSLPMTCNLSPGNMTVSPLGIFRRCEPRMILLISTPNRSRRCSSLSVFPPHDESSGTSKSPIWMSRSNKCPS